MTLLAQTAAPGVNPVSGLAAYAGAMPVTVGAFTADRGVNISLGNVFPYAPLGPYTAFKLWPMPLNVITPVPVWWTQTSWPINMAIILNFGLLVNPPAGSKRVSGTFQDQNGAAIARVGFLYDRSTGALLGSVNSSAIDGSWTAYVPTVNPVFVALIPSPGDSRNGVMLDNLVPI